MKPELTNMNIGMGMNGKGMRKVFIPLPNIPLPPPDVCRVVTNAATDNETKTTETTVVTELCEKFLNGGNYGRA